LSTKDKHDKHHHHKHDHDGNKFNPDKDQTRVNFWSTDGTQAGKEIPARPKKLEIWNNRRINLKEFDRKYSEGWEYRKTKFLDLHPDGNLTTLEPLKERPNLIKAYVNIHDELPDGIVAQRKVEKKVEVDPNADYNIRAMWKRL
jgi:hypothetical protein